MDYHCINILFNYQYQFLYAFYLIISSGYYVSDNKIHELNRVTSAIVFLLIASGSFNVIL